MVRILIGVDEVPTQLKAFVIVFVEAVVNKTVTGAVKLKLVNVLFPVSVTGVPLERPTMLNVPKLLPLPANVWDPVNTAVDMEIVAPVQVNVCVPVILQTAALPPVSVNVPVPQLIG